jgi:hypothetical protein
LLTVASGNRTRSARSIIVRDWLSYTIASVKTLALGPARQVRRTPPGPRHGRFRRWRRSRPYWGGLLLILAGAEMVLIPLASLLIHGGIKLVIYIGIGGVFGVLIGVLLITAGVLLWISPAHKTFYAIAGVALAILSFPASNLGGFFLGMLLGLVGGGLAFAWTQDPVDEDSVPTGPLPPLRVQVPLEEVLKGPEPETRPDVAVAPGEEDDGAPGGRHRSSRLLAGAAMPVLLATSLLSGHTAAQRRAVPDTPSGGCILWVICFPSAPPPPTASPGPSASATPSPSSSRARMIARADMGLEASTATTVLTAGSATLDGLAYQGSAKVPTADGDQTMMVFTLNSMTLSGNVTTTVTQDGQTTVTTASTLAFSGGITLYATKLSGTLLGVPTTLTPDSVLSVLLHLLNTVTPAIPLTMTNVTTDQPLVLAGGLQAANLSVTT